MRALQGVYEVFYSNHNIYRNRFASSIHNVRTCRLDVTLGCVRVGLCVCVWDGVFVGLCLHVGLCLCGVVCVCVKLTPVVSPRYNYGEYQLLLYLQ